MPTTCYMEYPYLTCTALLKVTTWQGKSVIKNTNNITNNSSITSILSSPSHRTWGKMDTLKIPSDRRYGEHQQLLRHETRKI